MSSRRTVTRAVVVVVAAAMLGLVAPTPAPAGCAGPSITVGPVGSGTSPAEGGAVNAGQRLTVSGEWFHSGCDDTYSSTGGCTAQPQQSSEAPLKGVVLTLRQGGSRWVLGTADAAGRGQRYAVSWRVRIPAAVTPGPATLVANDATLPVTITA